MSTQRYSQSAQPLRLGERGWRGVNMRVHPTLLPPGVAASASNCRFRNGIVEGRGGAAKLPWLNRLDPATPTQILPYTTIYGQGAFGDPDDVLWHVLAADGAVYRRRDSNAPQSIPLPAEVSIRYPVNFVQAFGSLLLFRGARLMPLVANDVDAGFVNITTGLANFRYRPTYANGTEIVWPPQPGFAWDTALTYGSGDLVLFQRQHWLANANTSAAESPVTTPAKWDLVSWSSASSYTVGKTVVYEATRFTALLDTTPGQSPLSNPEKWTVVAHKIYAAANAPTAGDTPVSAPTKWSYTRDIIPYGDTALFLQNRIFIPHDRDLVAASDTQSLATYVKATGELYVNQGSADKLLAIAKFNDNTIVAFKEHSVYAIQNVYGDLSDIVLNELTRSYGLSGAKAFANVGKDLWFLSQRGVVSLVQTTLNKIQGVELPVSDAIQPLIDRINWQYATLANAAYWDNKFYLAVPLDEASYLGAALGTIGAFGHGNTENVTVGYLQFGHKYRYTRGTAEEYLHFADDSDFTGGDFISTQLADGTGPYVNYCVITTATAGSVGMVQPVFEQCNNAILIYDFLNQSWSGHDDGEAVTPKEFFLCDFAGRERLAYTATDGFCNLYEEGGGDEIAGNTTTDFSEQILPLAGATSDGPELWLAGTTHTFTYGLQSLTLTLNGATVMVEGTDYSIHNSVVTFLKDFIVTTTVVADGVYILSTVQHAEITTTLVTRAFGPEDLIRWNEAQFHLATWNPSFSINAIFPGANESRALYTSQTRSRTKYFKPFDRQGFNVSNVNSDHEEPFRQDYSIDFTGGVYLDTGARLDLFQDYIFRTKLARIDSAVQFEIINAQGRLKVLSLALEGTAATSRKGILA